MPRVDAAHAHIGPFVVVGPEPSGSEVSDLLDVLKQVLTQPVVAHSTIVSLHVGVLLRLARLDVVDTNPVLLRSDLQAMADILRTVVATYGFRLAAPFHDLLQYPDDSLGRQREVRFDGQAIPVEVIDHVQQATTSPIVLQVVHVVHGQRLACDLGLDQRNRFLPDHSRLRLNACGGSS